jgi:hypothetical protein
MSASLEPSEERQHRKFRVLSLFSRPRGKIAQQAGLEGTDQLFGLEADGLGFDMEKWLERDKRREDRLRTMNQAPLPRRRRARSDPAAA